MTVVILVVVIVLSFWISFLIGKKMLIPVKKIPTQYLLTEEARPLIPPEITLEVEGLTFEAVPQHEKKSVEKKTILRPITFKKTVEKKKIAEKKYAAVKVATGAYTVQLGAFSQYKNAQAVSKKLTEIGYAADIKSSGRLYRVCSGSFDDLAEARSYLNKITAAGFEGIVRRND